MSHVLPFVKMHGAGNDFILIAASSLPFPELPAATIADLCDRRHGIGADGLITIADGNAETDFSMTYYNADGLPAKMCGNGARCAVAFARRLDLFSTDCVFDTAAGRLHGKWLAAEMIEVSLPAWSDLDLDLQLTDSVFLEHYFCNTGVPHLVIPVPDVEVIDVEQQGSALRRHQKFVPAGTNVNWVDERGPAGRLRYRTYERGVEGETLACGTGAAACAVVLAGLQRVSSPVVLQTRGGDLLTVTIDLETPELLLRGPVAVSFTGEYTIDE